MLKKDLKYYRTSQITAGCSAKSMRDNIKGFYKDQFGVEPQVQRMCELNNLTLTNNCTHEDVTTHIYTITVPVSIKRPSVLTVIPVANTTMSDQDWIYSESISLSTPPMRGKFFLECYDTQGNPYFTEDLGFSADPNAIREHLIATCPWLRDAIIVFAQEKYSYNVDGIDFLIYFRGVKGALNQFKIHSSFTEPLIGTNITYEMESLDQYGSKVYYDVLPFEQLYTY